MTACLALAPRLLRPAVAPRELLSTATCRSLRHSGDGVASASQPGRPLSDVVPAHPLLGPSAEPRLAGGLPARSSAPSRTQRPPPNTQPQTPDVTLTRPTGWPRSHHWRGLSRPGHREYDSTDTATSSRRPTLSSICPRSLAARRAKNSLPAIPIGRPQGPDRSAQPEAPTRTPPPAAGPQPGYKAQTPAAASHKPKARQCPRARAQGPAWQPHAQCPQWSVRTQGPSRRQQTQSPTNVRQPRPRGQTAGRESQGLRHGSQSPATAVASRKPYVRASSDHSQTPGPTSQTSRLKPPAANH